MEAGADVHVYSDRPLFNACNDRYVGIVVKLVEAGADLEHLKMYWVDLFGCEAPGDLANMSVSEVKELLEVETVRMELI